MRASSTSDFSHVWIEIIVVIGDFSLANNSLPISFVLKNVMQQVAKRKQQFQVFLWGLLKICFVPSDRTCQLPWAIAINLDAYSLYIDLTIVEVFGLSKYILEAVFLLFDSLFNNFYIIIAVGFI